MLRYETRDHYAILTMNRPEARNAINPAMAAAIADGLDRLEADDDIWLGILTGAPPAFCAGADLKSMRDDPGGLITTKPGGFAGIAQRERDKPIIAAVDGPALAGGTEIVLACDLVVASRRATFGLPEVKRSLVAASGGLFRLPRKIPFNVAMECALTGDPITAERAYELGLVNALCDDGEALEQACQLADRICVNAPVAVRESRRVLIDTLYQSDEVSQRRSAEGLRTAQRSEDFREGLDAFIEKRPPRWKAR
jgi:enoyl-CoA hydratase